MRPAAAHNLLAQRIEVAGRDVIPGRADLVVHVRHAVTFTDGDLAPVILQWRVESQRCALHAGDVCQPILQLNVHGVEFRLRISGIRACEADGHPVIGFVTESLMLQVLQTAGQQSGAGDQDNR